MPQGQSKSVSVVIPAYNQGPYIGEALESVLRSSLPPHETIVVNDGSTDNTEEVCNSFGGRVTVIRQVNSGVSAARNAGLRASTGELVMLLDSDDILEPDWIRLSTQALLSVRRTQPRTHVVHGDYTLFDNEGTYNKRVSIGKVTLPRLLRDSTLLPSALLMTKECVAAVGEFDGSVNTCEDWDYSLRIALRGFEFHHEKHPAFRHREHSNSASKRQENALTARIRFLAKWQNSEELAPDQRDVIRGETTRTLLRCRRNAYFNGQPTEQWTQAACGGLASKDIDPWMVSYGSVYVAPFFRRNRSRQQVRAAASTLRDEMLAAMAARGEGSSTLRRRLDASVKLALAADAALSRNFLLASLDVASAFRRDPSLLLDSARRSSKYAAEGLRAWLSA
jgi:glycosyltransferase involved in cell wall biosynthesis